MSVLKSGLTVSIFTLISRIMGFIRDIFISSSLGAGVLSDIFNVAFRLPNFFRRIFAEGAFNAAFIPIYNSKLENKDKSKEFANQTYTILFIALLVFIVIVELALPLIIYILAPGFENNSFEWHKSIELCRISMPYLLFISLISFFSAILNCHERYAAAAANPILLNVAIIISLITLKDYLNSSLEALVWGIFIAGVIQLFFIALAIKSANLLPKFTKPDLTIDMKQLLKKMVPVILGGGVMQINILVDQAIASFLAPGSISFLAYADRINQLPLALIGTAIGTVLLPLLSKVTKTANFDKIYNIQNRALEIAILLVLPATFAIIDLSDDIIYVLFRRGEFTQSDSINTAKALAIFTFGLPAYVIVKILLPSFFANHDTKTPLKISIICLISNIVTNLILVQYLSYLAIAISTALSAWLNCFLIYYNLNKRNLIKLDERFKFNIFKIFVSCIFMIIVLKIFRYFMGNYFVKAYHLIIEVVLGGASFLIASYSLKIFNFKEMKLLIKYKESNN